MHLVHEIFAKIEQEHSALWKNEKIFRQINYLAFSLVKPLLSRKIFQKSVMRVNFRNFHTVNVSE